MRKVWVSAGSLVFLVLVSGADGWARGGGRRRRRRKVIVVTHWADENGDGKVTGEEYKRFIEKVREGRGDFRNALLEKYDLNKNGRLDEAEMALLELDLVDERERLRREIFARFDVNRDDTLQEDEQKALREAIADYKERCFRLWERRKDFLDWREDARDRLEALIDRHEDIFNRVRNREQREQLEKLLAARREALEKKDRRKALTLTREIRALRVRIEAAFKEKGPPDPKPADPADPDPAPAQPIVQEKAPDPGNPEAEVAEEDLLDF